MENEKNFEMPVTIDLSKPVVIRNKKSGDQIASISKITFRNDLTAGMMGEFPADGTGMKFHHFFPIVSKMTGETQDTVEKLAIEDMTKCMEVVTHFLPSGPTTGDS